MTRNTFPQDLDPTEGIDQLIINDQTSPKVRLVALKKFMEESAYLSLTQAISTGIRDFEVDL